MSLQIGEAIAVISDVHGNVYALDAVLADVERRGISQVVNLGDSLFGPIKPVETAERMMNYPNLISIRGNCDRYLLENKTDSLTYQQVYPLLSPEILDWLRSHPTTYAWEDILFCHATPFTDDASLIEKVTEDGVVDKPIEVLSAELQAIPQKVIVCGHTHVPKNVFLSDGKWIVNPGSVGFPAYYEESPHPHVMESHSPHAKYAILQRVEEGWSLAHVCIPYDWERASRRAEQFGRMDYAYAIRSGKAYIPQA